MGLFAIKSRLMGWLGLDNKPESTRAPHTRPLQNHVIILDGTLSTLDPGHETNAGITYKLLQEVQSDITIYYEQGIQWTDFKSTRDVITGRGINRQIRRAYGALASRYRPGDKIFLLGYSRGAFAVRSLAGVIDRVGLLLPEYTTTRNIRQIYRHYEFNPDGAASNVFAQRHCHNKVEIEMLGGWEPVKALGFRPPIACKFLKDKHRFHDHNLGKSIKHGYLAFARDETRNAFKPILWDYDPNWPGHMEQCVFKGTHADIGGQVGAHQDSRGLSNIPLVWMLENAEKCGLPLPQGWKLRFPTDPSAPSVGTWQSWAKILINRSRRKFPENPSIRLHDSATFENQDPKTPTVVDSSLN